VDRSEDASFDRIYPPAVRLLSGRFWTPVCVARRAAEMFRDTRATRVLDVGSGAGKFVLAAAMAAPTVEFVGMEQRAHLVKVARQARAELGVPNAVFLVGDATCVTWSEFDGVYLFNPLVENLFAGEDTIDYSVELSQGRFVRDALRIEGGLRATRSGTAVVTYHGSSTRIPGCFALQASEPIGSDYLHLWTRSTEVDDGSYFVESDARVRRHWPGAPTSRASSTADARSSAKKTMRG
jgi:SAM-dependent methyltransferase